MIVTVEYGTWIVPEGLVDPGRRYDNCTFFIAEDGVSFGMANTSAVDSIVSGDYWLVAQGEFFSGLREDQKKSLNSLLFAFSRLKRPTSVTVNIP